MMFEIIKICFKECQVTLTKLLFKQAALYSMLLSFLILIAPDVLWATGTNPSLQVTESNFSTTEIEKQIKHLKYSIITLQESVSQQHQTINSRYSQFEEGLNKANTNLHKLGDNLNSLDNDVSKNSNQIYKFQIEANKIFLDNARNKQGSMLILLSLLFEIPAVIFLSSTSFIETQKDVFTLKRSPNMIASWGSGLEPLDTKIRYLSFVALTLLFAGFALQFIGIVYILILSLKLILVCVSILIIISFLVIFYLLGIGSQTRSEKLKTFTRNTKRLLLQFIKIETKRCDYCLKMMNCIDTEIWWLDHASDEPYNGMIRIGHKKCLEKSNWFNPNRTPKIHKSTLNTFLKDDVHRIKEKWNEKRKKNGKRESNYPNITSPEWDFNRVINKAKTIKNV